MSDEAKPFAWAVMGDDDDYEYVTLLSKLAGAVAEEEEEGGVVVPLYRHPSPTLTDAEREAVEWASDAYENCFCQRVGLDNNGPDDCGRVAATLRGLLERTK